MTGQRQFAVLQKDSTSPSAEQLKRDPEKVVHELDLRLRKDPERKGDFSRIHPCF